MKYKIIYTEGRETPELELLELLNEWNCTDGLGGCKYYKNGEEISLKEFTEDFYKAIEKEAGENKDDKIIASSGYSAKVASSGDYAKVASSGDYAQVASSGDYAKVASSGYSAKVVSSGYSAQVASSGYYAKVASSGDSAKVASSGYYAKVASSGDYAKHDIRGKESVCFDCGIGGIVKGIKGTYIALCEWYYDNNKWQIRATTTTQIDGKKLKENTYYGLYNGKITEIDFTDNIKSAVIETKGKVKKIKMINENTNTIIDNVGYVVADDNGNFAHGKTIKEAKNSLLYKISSRDTSQYKDLTLNSKLTFGEAIKMYRVITGACEFGTKNFIEQNKIDEKKTYTIKEIINITSGQYGNQKLQEFFQK
jgi:hypothetical protein